MADEYTVLPNYWTP